MLFQIVFQSFLLKMFCNVVFTGLAECLVVEAGGCEIYTDLLTQDISYHTCTVDDYDGLAIFIEDRVFFSRGHVDNMARYPLRATIVSIRYGCDSTLFLLDTVGKVLVAADNVCVKLLAKDLPTDA